MRAIAVKSFKSTPEIVDLPTPQPKQDEVLVHLSVAGINPFDWKVADGMLDGQVPHTFPLVIGFDGAGRIEAVGSGIKRFKVGDEVFGQFWQIPLGRGTYAEFCAVSENAPIARKPASLGAVDAAALPTAGMAALGLLEKCGLKGGDSLLIVGATGGVGQFLIQLAAEQNLRVIATGTQKDVATLKGLGATVVVDFTAGNVSKQVQEQFPNGIDGLVDLVSDPTGFADYAGLVRGGCVALTTNYVADEKALTMARRRGGNFVLAANPELVERLGASAGRGKLKISIEKRVPFDAAIAAITAAKTGNARGKSVILI